MRWKSVRWVVGDLVRYSVVSRRWWLLPVLVALLGAAALAAVGQVVAPYAVYPMF